MGDPCACLSRRKNAKWQASAVAEVILPLFSITSDEPYDLGKARNLSNVLDQIPDGSHKNPVSKSSLRVWSFNGATDCIENQHAKPLPIITWILAAV